MSKNRDSQALRCSFCHISQDVVGTLFSSHFDYPRAYICDECIVLCNDILKDERTEAAAAGTEASPEVHDIWDHPLAGEFLDAIERWVILERDGRDASAALSEMKRLGVSSLAPDSRLLTPGS